MRHQGSLLISTELYGTVAIYIFLLVVHDGHLSFASGAKQRGLGWKSLAGKATGGPVSSAAWRKGTAGEVFRHGTVDHMASI